MKPAVAFLQNMWCRDPEMVRDGVARWGNRYWRRATYQFLFAGCVTGRRLKKAFGPLIDQIEWEEATREIAGDSKTICLPQPEHIRAVLEELKPRVVLTFGNVAGDAVAAIWTGPLIRVRHPAARQANTVTKLNEAALEFSLHMEREVREAWILGAGAPRLLGI